MSIEELVAVVGGLALLLVPGALLLGALGADGELRPEERPAAYFAATLAVLALPAALAALRPIPLDAVVAWVVILALLAGGVVWLRTRKRGETDRLAAVAAQRKSASTALTSASPADGADPARAADIVSVPLALWLAAGVAAVLLTLGAHEFTRGGSVDRWWYLAFVRAFLVEDRIGTADPLFGTGTTITRFACNSWLTALAVWSRVTTIDPVVIYERAAPLLLAPVALSATAMAVRALLGDRRLAVASVVIAAAFWTSGGPFPALTRLPEDKLLAVLVLVPVLWAAVVRAVQRPTAEPRPLALVALAAAALATVHPLVFVIGLVTIGPALLVARPRVAGTLALVLTVVATVPIAVGLGAREQAEAAASLEAEEHPVGRVHLSRERLSEVGGFLQVEPRLLADPLSILALLTLPLLAFRRGRERALLAIPSVAALALCFAPPFPTLLARAVTPWMVYRFLWAIPFVPLLTVLVREAARRMPLGSAVPLGCVVVIAAPAMMSAVELHTRAAREALGTPQTAEFRALVGALRALPPASSIAAAPELAERIPGLTGRHVLAASDRATVVFAGGLEVAEKRLRDRAALLAGIWRQSEEVPLPSHVVFAPGAPAARYCGEEIFASDHYVVCRFHAAEPPPGMKLGELGADVSDATELQLAGASTGGYRVDCNPRREPSAETIVFPRPGPWSARAPGVTCTLTAAVGAADEHGAVTSLHPRALSLEVVTGRAVEELTILARAEREGGQRWNLRTRTTVHHGDRLRYALPSGAVDRIEVTLIPSRLPFVKLGSLAVLLDARPTLGSAE